MVKVPKNNGDVFMLKFINWGEEQEKSINNYFF